MSVNSNKRAGGFARMGGMIMGGHDAMPSQKPFSNTMFQEDRPSVLSRGLSKSPRISQISKPNRQNHHLKAFSDPKTNRLHAYC